MNEQILTCLDRILAIMEEMSRYSVEDPDDGSYLRSMIHKVQDTVMTMQEDLDRERRSNELD